MSDTQDYTLNDLNLLNRKATAQLNLFTRKENAITSTCEWIETNKHLVTQKTVDDIQKALDAFETINTDLEFYYQAILSIEGLPAADQRRVSDNDTGCEERAKTLRQRVQATYIIPKDGRDGRPSKNRPELKPPVLKESDPPTKMSYWIEFMCEYFYQSGFGADKLSTQHGLILQNLEPELQKKMMPKFKTDAAKTYQVFHDNPKDHPMQEGTIMGILIQHWKEVYPIQTRRMAFFSQKQRYPAESVLEYYIRMNELDKSADLSSMTAEEAFITGFLGTIVDPYYMRELRNLRNITTREELEQEITRLETAQRECKYFLQNEQQINKVNTDYRKRKEEAMSPTQNHGNDKGQPKPRMRRVPESAKGMCLCCGLRDHAYDACKQRKTAKCNICKKTGHLGAACIKIYWAKDKANEAKNKPSTASANMVTSGDDTNEPPTDSLTSELASLNMSADNPDNYDSMFEFF